MYMYIQCLDLILNFVQTCIILCIMYMSYGFYGYTTQKTIVQE